MRSIRSMTTTQNILDSIETRLRELNDEIETLSAARSALDGGEATPAQRSRPTTAPSVTSRSPRRRAARTRRSGNGKATEVVPAGRLELLLTENGGLTTTALAEHSGGDRDQVLTLLRELETAGRVRRSGQRRSTRWHAITDEDRIRERAAELARRRKRTA